MDYYKHSLGHNKPLKVKYKATMSSQILRKNIAEIASVNDWADKVGVSRNWLNYVIKHYYGMVPKVYLRKIRFKKIISLIVKFGIQANSYSVALDSGLRNDDALYKFLSRHYDTNFKKLKRSVLELVNEDNMTSYSKHISEIYRNKSAG